jgi:choline dehydrogenase-like flavoprotein
MFLDLEDEGCPEEFAVDVCIVGAGPAGITIAQQFIDSRLRVCLAESGGFTEEHATQALYDGESVGHPITLTAGRHRMFGGSGVRWGGRSAVLDPLDFEKRSWVKHSGWPISWETLQPYYDRAKQLSNFKQPWCTNADVLRSIHREFPRFSTTDIVPYVWRTAAADLRRGPGTYLAIGFRKKFDWAKSYKRALGSHSNIRVVLHATMVAMTANDAGDEIKSAKFKSLSGRELRICARVFVICCSGIENARILLDLPAHVLSRINIYDNIGRYFAQHPRGTILTIETTKAAARTLQGQFNVFSRPARVPVQYEIGFALSESAQRTHQLLNASASMRYKSETTSWASAKRLRRALRSRLPFPQLIADTKNLISGAGSMIENLVRRYLIGRELIITDPAISVVVDLEQEPNRDSRITLSKDVDELGVRRPRIDWKISECERRTARELAKLIAHELEHWGFGRAKLEPWLTSDMPVREGDLWGNYHFIGATRMASVHREGVVDENCRVYGVSNLYVAGCSVFPTGGHANPTLTIVALAIRLADHLKDLEAAARRCP